MKKHSRLLCAILVIAVLASSLAFVVGAEGEDAFIKSYEVTDFASNKISDGVKDFASAQVDGNLINGVTTMNESNSPFITMGKVNGANPYVVSYTNKTFSGKPTSENNLSVSLGMTPSDPIPVIGSGVKGYYVFDMDVATLGRVVSDVTVSMVMRRAMDNSGFPFSDDIMISNYITELEAWSHLTIIGDIVNNVAKIYIDGQYVGDGGLAVRTSNEANKLASDTKVTAQGVRVQMTRNNIQTNVEDGDNIAMDNFAYRLYIEDGADIAAAMSDNDITDWAGYNGGRSGEKLPVLANVDGVACRNASLLAKALSTNDTVDVEFKAAPLGPVVVNANAVINTNGMPKGDLITLSSVCTISSEKGNIITTYAPFVSNVIEKNIKGTVNTVVRASNSDNQLGAVDGPAGLQYIGYNVANMRGTFLVTDTYTGHKYIRDTVYSGTVPEGANTYIDWHTNNDSSNMAYKLGVDQHIIFDIDFALIERGTHININPITRTSGGSGVWGNTSAYFDDIFTAAGIPDGEFAHVTAVVTIDTRAMTIFVNGKYVMTVENSLSTNVEGHYCNGIRTFSSSDATAGYSNVSLRCVKNADLTAAVNAQDISLWSGNLYTDDYQMIQHPAIATIDGVAYHNEADMEAALYGNKEKPAVVKILHVFDEEITVNCDANVYTYGQDVKFVDVNGNALVPESNGVIVLDIPYMQNREEEKLSAGAGLNDMTNVYSAVKADVNGNIFNSFKMNSAERGIWGSVGYRTASLITNVDTGEVFYRESAIPGANGTMSAGGNQYVNMYFDSFDLTYEEGKNEYVVADFDFGTDGVIDDNFSVQLIPRKDGSGAWASVVTLDDIGIASGEMAHVTIVFDLTNNYAHVYVNGIYIKSVEEGAIDGAVTTHVAGDVWTDEYLAGVALGVNEIKICSNQKTSTVCFDNIAIRTYDLEADADGIAKAITAMDITKWVDSIYTEDYVSTKLPAVATVDGEDYGSIIALNEALAKESVYPKTVVIKHTPSAAVKIYNDATVETNALEVTIDSDTGAYEFDPGIPAYRSTATGLAYATSRLLKSVVGTTYNFRTISAENCMNSATAVVWAYDAEFKSYDVVFYAYGDTIAPLDGGEYVKGTTFYREQWAEMTLGDDGFVTGDIVSAFPVASPITATQFYLFSPYTYDAPFAATDLRYGAKIDTNIEFTLYVNKAETTTDTGKTVVIGSNEYVAITYYLAPNEISKVITVTFDIVDENGVTYVQKQNICFVDYAEALLTTFGTEEDKALTVAFLDYANEAHALFDKDGAKMDRVSALVEAYASYLPANDLTEKLDTSALAPYIRSAAMKLDTAPAFVFKVARGFVGTIEFSFNHIGTPVSYTFDMDTSDVEELIVLDTLAVFDLCSDITVTVTTGDVTVSGAYNLASYAQGLAQNTFAVALYNYAKVALAYKTGSFEFATPEI